MKVWRLQKPMKKWMGMVNDFIGIIEQSMALLTVFSLLDSS